jgi:hypothetical protein
MKQPLHPAVECLKAAKERPVELADLDGSRSAIAEVPATLRLRLFCASKPPLGYADWAASGFADSL